MSFEKQANTGKRNSWKKEVLEKRSVGKRSVGKNKCWKKEVLEKEKC